MQFTIRNALAITAVVAAATASYLWATASTPTRLFFNASFNNRPEHIKEIARDLSRLSGELTLEQFGRRINKLGFTLTPKPLDYQGCEYHWAIKPCPNSPRYILTAAFFSNADDPLRYTTISVINEQTGAKDPIWHAEYFNPKSAAFEDIQPNLEFIQKQNWSTN